MQAFQKTEDGLKLASESSMRNGIAEQDRQMAYHIKEAVKFQSSKEALLKEMEYSKKMYDSVVNDVHVCELTNYGLNPRVTIRESFISLVDIRINGNVELEDDDKKAVNCITNLKLESNSSIYRVGNLLPSVAYNIVEFGLKRYDGNIVTGLLSVPICLDIKSAVGLPGAAKTPNILMLETSEHILGRISPDKESMLFKRCATNSENLAEFKDHTLVSFKRKVREYIPEYILKAKLNPKEYIGSSAASKAIFQSFICGAKSTVSSTNMLKLVKMFTYDMDIAGTVFSILDDICTYEESMAELYSRIKPAEVKEDSKPEIHYKLEIGHSGTKKEVEWIGVAKYAKKKAELEAAAKAAEEPEKKESALKRRLRIAQAARAVENNTMAAASSTRTEPILTAGQCSFCHNNVSETYTCPRCGGHICTAHAIITGSGANERGWCPSCAGSTEYMNAVRALSGGGANANS